MPRLDAIVNQRHLEMVIHQYRSVFLFKRRGYLARVVAAHRTVPA
jgi:hypothetical protein